MNSQQDLLNAALTMVGDISQLDKDGLTSFGAAFKENIHPPSKISNQVKQGAMSLAASACSYIFWTIFIVASVILLSLAFLEIITWLVAGVMILIIGGLILLMASLLYNRVNDYTSLATKELNTHIAEYSERILGDIINALKSGIIAYASNRSGTSDVPEPDYGDLDL